MTRPSMHLSVASSALSVARCETFSITFLTTDY